MTRRPDRGQGSLESVGVIAVAAILIAAVIAATVQTNPALTSAIKAGICKVTTLGQGDCKAEIELRAPEDYIPPEPCVVSSNGQEDEAKVSLVVTLSNGETWLIEDLGDGKSRLTRSTSGGVGIGAGVGFDVSVQVDGSKYGVALTASAEAMFKGVQGETYYADSPEEAEEILNQKRTDDSKDFWLGDQGNPIRDGWDWATGKGEHENASPDEWFEEGGFDASGYAGATGLYETASVGATEEAYLGTKHSKNGNTTDYFRGSASVTAGVDAWTGDGTYEAVAQAGMEAMVEIERDKDGNPISMRMTSTVMADAEAGDKGENAPPTYTQRTVQIPLDTEANRDIASRTLWAAGIPFMPGLNEGITDADAIGAPWQIDQIGRDLAEAANTGGHIWEQEYTQDTSENGFTFDAKAIAELGLSGTSNSIETALTDYKYWNGSQMVSREGCGA
jgi:hypothetical protein